MQEPANDNPQLALARINMSLRRVTRNFVHETIALAVTAVCVSAFVAGLVLLFGGPR